MMAILQATRSAPHAKILPTRRNLVTVKFGALAHAQEGLSIGEPRNALHRLLLTWLLGLSIRTDHGKTPMLA